MRCISIVRSLYFKYACSLFIVSDYNVWLVIGE
jgi:hypothetical protein